MKKIKVGYITGSRADFGPMSLILEKISRSKKLILLLYVTGMHMMKEHGHTISLVSKLYPQANILDADYSTGTLEDAAQFSAKFLQQVVTALSENKPDIMLLFGDRAEMLVTAIACLYLRIPCAHIHGGEVTGTVDELARHAITKLSHLHFAATPSSATRLKKLGEDEWRITTTGAPALDIILNQKLPTKKELYKKIGFDLNSTYILLLQHPVSESIKKSGDQMRLLLKVVKKFELPVVVIYPNAVPGSKEMIVEINKYQKNPLFRIFSNIEYPFFLALEREAAVWVGNSSASVIESSSFCTPVVLVGSRQRNRECGKNVITVSVNQDKIIKAIKKSLFDEKYLLSLLAVKNPWGDGKASKRIAGRLESITLNEKLLNKQLAY